MKYRTIITISRQYGSGGRNIGRKLAKTLDIPFYDKDLIYEAAKESGINPEVAKDLEERPTNALLYSYSPTSFFSMSNYSPEIKLPLTDLLFLAQADAIRKFADMGSCVIVGRCGNYILREDPDTIDLYIHRAFAERVNQIQKREDISRREAVDLVKRTDKHRQNYHNHYTDFKWGGSDNYDLVINSGMLGEDGAVAVIEKFVEMWGIRRKSRNR